MDNYSINKNYTFIAAIGTLAVFSTFVSGHHWLFVCVKVNIFILGVCRKIKASYGQRGHGHSDNDANVGNISWMFTKI